MNGPNDLAEALAWLDYCLEETATAMEAVKAAAAAPGVTGKHYHEICESAARITTLKGRTADWIKAGSGV